MGCPLRLLKRLEIPRVLHDLPVVISDSVGKWAHGRVPAVQKGLQKSKRMPMLVISSNASAVSNLQVKLPQSISPTVGNYFRWRGSPCSVQVMPGLVSQDSNPGSAFGVEARH